MPALLAIPLMAPTDRRPQSGTSLHECRGGRRGRRGACTERSSDNRQSAMIVKRGKIQTDTPPIISRAGTLTQRHARLIGIENPKGRVSVAPTFGAGGCRGGSGPRTRPTADLLCQQTPVRIVARRAVRQSSATVAF